MGTTKLCSKCGDDLVDWPDHLRRRKLKCCRGCWRDLMREHRDTHPVEGLLYSARARAKKHGIICTLTKEDIKIPEVCPVLGIPIHIGSRGDKDNSASLDRIVPSRGYTPENVRVISWRANRIKCDATYDELVAITNYVKENLWTPPVATAASQ